MSETHRPGDGVVPGTRHQDGCDKITLVTHDSPARPLPFFDPPPVTTLLFCFGGKGTVEISYEEALALQRVARAQIEIEERRVRR
jgi:hypothetical protein